MTLPSDPDAIRPEIVEAETFLRFIVARLASELPLRGFGDLMARLMWILNLRTSDAIFLVLQSWIEGDDERLATLALSTEEFFFYSSIEEMETSFSRMTVKFPKLEARASALIAQRRKQNG